MPPLKVANLRQDIGDVELHGPMIKAARTRCMLPWVVTLVDEFFEGENPMDKAIRKTVYALQGLYATMYSAGMFFTDDEKALFRAHLATLGRWMPEAQRLGSDRGDPVFTIFPKSHYAQHLDEQCDLINPRYVQNYMDEGFIGKITRVWASCLNGPWKKNAARVVGVKMVMHAILKYLGVGPREL